MYFSTFFTNLSISIVMPMAKIWNVSRRCDQERLNHANYCLRCARYCTLTELRIHHLRGCPNKVLKPYDMATSLLSRRGQIMPTELDTVIRLNDKSTQVWSLDGPPRLKPSSVRWKLYALIQIPEIQSAAWQTRTVELSKIWGYNGLWEKINRIIYNDIILTWFFLVRIFDVSF